MYSSEGELRYVVIPLCGCVPQPERSVPVRCGESLPQAGHLAHARRDVLQFVVAENKRAQVFQAADGLGQAGDFIPLQPQRVQTLHPEELKEVSAMSRSHTIWTPWFLGT